MTDNCADDVLDALEPSLARPRFVPLSMAPVVSAASRPALAFSAWVELDTDPERAESIRREHLIATVVALLHRYTQQPHVAVDVIIRDGRLDDLVALDLEVVPETAVDSLISDLAARLSSPRHHATTELETPSNVAITLLDRIVEAESIGLEMRPFQNYDINFILAAASGTLRIIIAYSPSLFPSSAIDRFISSYAILLTAALAEATTSVGLLPLLSPAEQRALTVDQDSGRADYPAEPVYRIFEAIARHQPTAVACSYHEDHLSYGELDHQSSILAAYLTSLGVGPEKAVAVCIPPCLKILPAILAIWKAGGIYLPLDPTHPEANIRRMLDEARPVVVLTFARLASLTQGFPQFCFDRDDALVPDHPATVTMRPARLTDAAYLFYTSGTTGKPKGVVATQGNLRQYIQSGIQKYGFCADDIFISLARYTFSISLFDLISPLCSGGSVRILDRDDILTPKELYKALEGVTVVHAGPSLLGSLFRYIRATPSAPRTLPRMRHASSGGDMIPPSVVEEMKTVFPAAELFVIYGCTEVSCMGTTYQIPRDLPATRNFVGKPFPNVTARVLDANRALVGFGVVGEICFAGDGIVRGYLDMPELTKDKFADIDGRRFYRTGDIGRLHDDGNLEILGRRDFQIQLRGIRIELAGIETTIVGLGLAAQCAVIAKTFGEADTRLAAFVVGPGVDRLDVFRMALAKELPDYMLPQHVIVLEAMPLTVNGKLDRNRLKDLPWENQLGAAGDSSASATELEQTIADVFAGVLEIPSVGVDDSFFDLGGNSLLGVVALDEMRVAIGVTIPPHVLFENATARAIARYLSSGNQPPSSPILLSASASHRPIFMLSGIHIYRELARCLEGSFSAYGIFSPWEIDTVDATVRSRSVVDLANEYISAIRRQEPSGPYIVLGYSFSGLVAYEVCRQLRAAGEEVRLLAIVDSDLPEWTLRWQFRLSQLRRFSATSPRHLASFIWRRVQEIFGWKLQPFMRFADHKKLGPLEAKRDAANILAAEDYMPQITPYPGNVLLVTSAVRLRADPLRSPNCGWARYMPSLEIRSVEADHFRMMSDDPYVSQIAEFLKKSVERAT